MSTAPTQPRGRTWIILPLLVFAGLAGIFIVGLQSGDPSKLPSALIGQPAPEFDLPQLDGLEADGQQIPALATVNFGNGKVTLLNVWASWCGPCRDEHPILMDLAKRDDINLVGINYKDQRENAVRFLTVLGNPFSRVGVDATGRTAVDYGVYGVPETFVIDQQGRVRYKKVGPLDAASLREGLLPVIDTLTAEPNT